ncbi:MAG: NRDE family protein [Ferruginibacter sp.]
MCTVTYIPSRHGCFLTSSRDENIKRPTAAAPAICRINDMDLIYPKDTKANGSWIACTQAGNAAVLLNGGFEKHIPSPPYRKSRGLVFLDIISSTQPLHYFASADLEKIEPFTLVLFIAGQLFETRWDGIQKHTIQLDENIPHIWSSVTLYTTEIIEKRRSWFREWIKNSAVASARSILNFHRFAGDGDTTNSIRMNRDNEMLTVSITSIDIRPDAATMEHFDLKENKHSIQSLVPETVLEQPKLLC